VEVRRSSDLPAALRALPGLLDQVAAARSVRVEPQGAQPLVVTAAGERATVSLGSSAGGSAAGAEALGAGRSAPAATGEQGSAWWTGLPARLALGVLAAAALLVAVERRRRRPTSARVPAPRRPVNQDDPWGRLVPEWTRTRPRTPETGNRDSGTPGTPPSSTPSRVIDLREPAQERPEVR
jgi:hypothetical protein